MELSAFQINNVIRVYKDQLRQNKMGRLTAENGFSPDQVNISAEAKRKIVTDKIASGIVDKIAQCGPQDTNEKEVFEKLENGYGVNMDISQKGSNEFLFKVIDEGGETINSLSIENSKFLAYKLQEIAVETVDEIERDKLGGIINEN